MVSIMTRSMAALLLVLGTAGIATAGTADPADGIFVISETPTLPGSGTDGPFIVTNTTDAGTCSSGSACGDQSLLGVWESRDPAPSVPGDLSPCPDCAVPEPSTGSLTGEAVAGGIAYVCLRLRRRRAAR